MANLDPWHYASKTGNEHAEQVALFMWANMAMRVGPLLAQDVRCYNEAGYAMREFEKHGGEPIRQLKWLHAIKNQRDGNNVVAGGRAKAEGVKPGVSDIFLPWPVRLAGAHNGAYPAQWFHGFYIELKRKEGGTPSPEQLEFQTDMRAVGYKVEIIHGWQLARDELLRYLGRL